MAIKKTPVRKIYRSETDHILGGVCGGLGEYFGLDSNLVRLIFVVLTFAGGSGLPLYLVLWVILPKKSRLDRSTEEVISDNTQEIKSKTKNIEDEVRLWSHKENSRQFVAVILLLLGIYLLIRNMGFAGLFPGDQFWPVLLILAGIVLFIRTSEKH